MKKAVISGMSIVSAAGVNTEAFFSALVHKQSGINTSADYKEKKYRTHMLAGITDPDYTRDSSIAAWIIRCILDALHQAGMEKTCLAEKKVMLMLGTFLGALGSRETGKDYTDEPFDRILEEVAHYFALPQPGLLFASACAAGIQAVCTGRDWIRNGMAEIVIAGGFEKIGDFAFAGMDGVKALGNEIHPFDARRKGTVLGEGVGIVILEEEAHALQRHAGILAEVGSYGLSNDAYHLFIPQPEAAGIKLALRMALEEDNTAIQTVDCIIAHGTGIRFNDSAETLAIKEVFKAQAARVPVTSIKPVVGHTLGAAGIMNIITAVLCLQKGILPPLAGWENPAPDCALKLSAEPVNLENIHTVLCHAFGFGGVNAVLAINRYSAAFTVKTGRTGTGSIREIIIEELDSAACDGFKLIENIIRICTPVFEAKDIKATSSSKIALVVDMESGLLSSQKFYWEEILTKSPRGASPTLFCHAFPGFLAGEMARHFQVTGPNITLCDSRATLFFAVQIAKNMIKYKKIETVILTKISRNKVVIIVLNRKPEGIDYRLFNKSNYAIAGLEKYIKFP